MYVAKKGTKLRPRTAELYLDCARRYFAKWATLPLRDLTPQMMEEEHARIGKTLVRQAPTTPCESFGRPTTTSPAMP